MSLHVVLVHPEIPWNTGNAGRTCLAFGAKLHLVRPLGFSLEDRFVRRAGLDYWQHVEPTIWPRWQDLEEALPKLGTPYFFTAEGEQDLWGVDYPEHAVLIFGSESCGLPGEIRSRWAERIVRVPMPGAEADGVVRSLNLSTTVAVACAEVLRRRA